MSDAVRKSIEVRCSVERAFTVFTERIDQWWPRGHRRAPDARLALDPRAGGRLVQRTPDGVETEMGRVLEWAPPHRLVYTWWPGAIDAPTTVEIDFRAVGALTRVQVNHHPGDSGLGDLWPERARRFDGGWARVLPALQSFIQED